MKKILISIGCAFATLTVNATSTIPFSKEISYKNPLVIVNGYKIRFVDYAKIKPEHIESIIELEPKDAVEVFGENGSNGAIIIKLIESFKGFSLDGAKIDERIIEKVAYYAEQAKLKEQARLEAEAKAKKDAEEKERLAAEAKAKRDELEAAKLAAEANARLTAAEKAKKEAEDKARKEFEENQRLENDAKNRADAEAKARKDAEEKAQLEAEAKAKKLAEEKERLEAEAKAKKEEEEKARLEAEAKAKKAAEEKARLEAEAKAKKDAEEKARLEAEEKKKQALKEIEDQKNNNQANTDFINKLEQDFKNSINNPKIKRVLIEGKEVTKKEAVKLSVFDVETSIITYDRVNGDGTIEIKLTKK